MGRKDVIPNQPQECNLSENQTQYP